MPAIDRFILLVRDLRRDQRGIAVPTALMALIASFALASVAVISTVHVQQGTKRDHDSKEAIAAADAGANIALLRLNRFLPYLSTTHPCIGPSGEYQTPTSGWCPVTASEQVGGATYKYMVSEFGSTGTVNVVSIGTSGTVSRRVNVGLKTLSGKRVFADEKLIGQSEISLEGGPIIETDIGTNGNILTSGGPYICGNDRHGIGKTGPNPNCPGKEQLEGNKNLPAITPPENITTVNDNCRLAQNCTGTKAGQVDTYSKKVSKTDPWDAEHLAINIGSSQTLTMGGNIYYVCELNVQGKLYMPVGAHVEIYVAPPTSKECGLKSGAQQVNIGAGAVIESSAYNPSQGLYEVPRIYVLGNGAVKLVGTPGTTNEVILYAPNSEVDLGGNATWNGMIAGNTLKIHGNPVVKSDPNLKEPEITLSGNFQRTQYVECVGAVATPPNASC
ncbi:MAG TPA: hypothetical protein VG448_07540 [Solirubrobacterales bacterium]|nr:hypothetical protein [Solirubrobacterales bacterium]